MIKNNFILVGLLVSVTLYVAGCEQPNPEQARQRLHLPSADFVADRKKGEHLFHDHCSRCHGEAGKGTNQGSPLIHKIYRSGHHADLTFHWAVKNGVKQHHWHFGDMPPVPAVSPQEVGHIIAYVRHKQRQAGIQ